MTLTLDHNPGEWDGTYAIVLRALIDDLLSDGAGFGAVITWQDDVVVVTTGLVSQVTDDGDVLLDMLLDIRPVPSKIPLLDIIRIEVP